MIWLVNVIWLRMHADRRVLDDRQGGCAGPSQHGGRGRSQGSSSRDEGHRRCVRFHLIKAMAVEYRLVLAAILMMLGLQATAIVRMFDPLHFYDSSVRQSACSRPETQASLRAYTTYIGSDDPPNSPPPFEAPISTALGADQPPGTE
jgi:hypothetical protein